MDLKHTDITELIKAFYAVYSNLGYGFLAKVYRNALMIEPGEMNLDAVQEAHIEVHYNGKTVGEYLGDILVSGVVVVELKATRKLSAEHGAQLLNYLKATPYEIGLLLNFGPKPEIRRRAFDNSRKGSMQWKKETKLERPIRNLRYLRKSASKEIHGKHTS